MADTTDLDLADLGHDMVVFTTGKMVDSTMPLTAAKSLNLPEWTLLPCLNASSRLPQAMPRLEQDQISHEADHRYRSLRALVADAFYHAIVKEGRVVFKCFNATFERLTGYAPDTSENVLHLDVSIAHDTDRGLLEKQISELVTGQSPGAIEYRLQHRDGTIRWIEKTVVPVIDQFGEVIAYDGLLRDITARKSQEEALRESEQRYRLIFEDDLTGDYVATPEGEILLCNPAFVRIFGFATREQVIGINFATLYEDPDSWRNLVRRVREHRFIERFERAIRRNDGTVLHIVENVHGSFDDRDQLVRVKGYIFDDSQTHLEASRLREHNVQLEKSVMERTKAVLEKHEQLQSIMNSAFDAIITISSCGIIQTVNLAAQRIFGHAEEDMLSHPIQKLLPSPYGEGKETYINQYLECGGSQAVHNVREVVGLRADGSTFPVELSITEVEQTRVFTCIVRDISERKQLQSHVLEIAADEQRRIGLELHDGVGQELTGLALHAGSLVELLKTAESPSNAHDVSLAKARELASRISTRLNETNRRVRQLAHGIMPVQIEPAGLQTALEELATSIDLQEAVDCRFECSDSIEILNNSVATHLYCIAQEALSNALRHSRADEITISLKNLEGRVALEIHDNGIGIEKANHEQGRISGGMGLRTMQYRCESIFGSFRVDSREGKGTSVICLVPPSGSGQ